MLKAFTRWSRDADHYYRITAVITAHGAQRAAWRALAITAMGLGACPVLMTLSPAGPHGVAGRWILVGIALFWAGVAKLLVARRRWPTRGQSLSTVAAGCGCIAVANVIQSDAQIGLYGCAEFIIVTSYVTCFHTAWYLFPTLALAAPGAVDLAIRVGVHGGVGLLVAELIISTTSTPLLLELSTQLLDGDVCEADPEQLSGLGNLESFYQSTAAMIDSADQESDRYLVLIVVGLDGLGLLVEIDGRVAGERARIAAARTIVDTFPCSAAVTQVGHDEFIIADTFATSDATPLAERLLSAIAATPPRLTASIGAVSTSLAALGTHPANDDVLDQLFTIGAIAMRDARYSAGGRPRYVVEPELSAPEDQRFTPWPQAEDFSDEEW